MIRQEGPEPMCETSEPNEGPITQDKLKAMRADIAWRVHEAFDFRPEHEIACLLKTSCGFVGSFLDGHELPTTETLLQIHAVTGASLHWILTGQGSRFSGTPRPVGHYTEEWVDLGLA